MISNEECMNKNFNKLKSKGRFLLITFETKTVPKVILKKCQFFFH